MATRLAVMILLACYDFSFGGAYKVSIHTGQPVFGGFSKDSESLRNGGSKTKEYQVSYLHGENNGILIGVMRGIEFSKYVQFTTTSRQYGKYSSNYQYDGIAIGYWHSVNPTFRFETGLNYGVGSFEFNLENIDPIILNDIRITNLFWNGIYPYSFFNEQFKIDFIGSMGLYKINVPDFSYNQISFTQSDLMQKLYFYMSIGIGFRF